MIKRRKIERHGRRKEGEEAKEKDKNTNTRKETRGKTKDAQKEKSEGEDVDEDDVGNAEMKRYRNSERTKDTQIQIILLFLYDLSPRIAENRNPIVTFHCVVAEHGWASTVLSRKELWLLSGSLAFWRDDC